MANQSTTGQQPNGSAQRSAPQGQAKPQQSTVEWAQQNIAGSFANAEDAAERLRMAAQHCHLIGGASICPLIEGHEVQITVVPINIADVYPVKGKEGDPPRKGIPKSTLMQLAAAAGIQWSYSRRQDDGADPHYCHWRVEGRYRQIDGTWRQIEGDRDVDNRDGSDQLYGKSEREIPQLRINTVRSAITKAKLRAIREAFGVAQGMLESELHKPFVFAKAIFTGRSSDPKVRQLFAAVIAQQQLAATAALYGTPTLPQLGAALQSASPQPSIGNSDIDPEDDMSDELSGAAKLGGDVTPARRAAPRPAPPPAPARPTAPARHNNGGSRGSSGSSNGHVVPFGRNKGKPITDVDDKELDFLLDYYSKAVSDPAKANFREKNEAELAAVRAEVALRSSGGVVNEDGDDAGRGDDLPY